MRKLSVVTFIVTFCLSVFMVSGSTVWAQTSMKTPAKAVKGGTPGGPPPNAVRGGTMRAVKYVFPKVLGYAPDLSPVDNPFDCPILDRLADWNEKGDLIPILAESWDWNPKTSALTWHLRKGIKFQDGTPFNAEAVKWFFDMGVETESLYESDSVKSTEVVDEYTLRMYLTDFSNMSVMDFGWGCRPMSPTAFKKNGGKEWARLHPVGTGPFKLASFSRDSVMRYEKNPDYWLKGYPLLDAIEIRYVPDPMTTQMMLESKEADICLEMTNVKVGVDLEKKGFKVNWGPGNVWALLPNSADPKSPLHSQKVREAIEYAIDRPALAKMLGFGKFEALTQIEPTISPAYVKGFDPRPYNPAKAKQLLVEAGFPNGFDTKLIVQEKDKDAGIGIQSYLNAVGIRIDLDVADGARFAVAVYSPQLYSGLALAWGGVNPDATDLFVHWGTHPMTHRYGQILKSKEYLDMCEKTLHTFDPAGLKKGLQQMVRQASDDAMIIPLYRDAQPTIMQQWVHSDYMKVHRQLWYAHEDWMEKHK